MRRPAPAWLALGLALAACAPQVEIPPVGVSSPTPGPSPTPLPVEGGVDDPRGLAVDELGAPWLVNGASGSLSAAGTVKYYDSAGQLRQSWVLGEPGGPCAWDAGVGALWTVTASSTTTLWRLSPGGSASFPLALGPRPTDVQGLAVAASGSVWLTDAGNDLVAHCVGGTLVSTVSLSASGAHPAGVAAAPDGVWVALRGSTSLFCYPEAGGVPTTRTAPAGLAGVVAIDKNRYVWASHELADGLSLTKFMASTQRGYNLYGEVPSALAADSRGFLWAALRSQNVVVRLTPANDVRSLYQGQQIVHPQLLACDSTGNAWVAGPGAFAFIAAAP